MKVEKADNLSPGSTFYLPSQPDQKLIILDPIKANGQVHSRYIISPNQPDCLGRTLVLFPSTYVKPFPIATSVLSSLEVGDLFLVLNNRWTFFSGRYPIFRLLKKGPFSKTWKVIQALPKKNLIDRQMNINTIILPL